MRKKANRFFSFILVLGIFLTAFSAFPQNCKAATEIIVDCDSIGGSVETDGTWNTSTTWPDYNGSNYRYNTSGNGSDKIRWRPNITEAGNYSVYYWLPYGDSSRATNTPFTVYYNGGSQTYYVNEQGAGGSWVLLGEHNFSTGTSGYVELTDNANGSYVIADSIKFVLTVEDIIIDSDSIGGSVETDGTWNTSTTLPDYNGSNYRYNTSGNGSDKIRWRPNITEAGNYSVYYWLPDGDSTRPTNASFTVYYNGGSQTYYVNEQGPGGFWMHLGVHDFSTGTSGYVWIR